MKARDVLAAVAVAVVWGLTFIAIKIGVGETTPLTLSALRFVFAALPAGVLRAAAEGALADSSRSTACSSASASSACCSSRFGEGFPVGLASLVDPAAGVLHHLSRLGADARAAAARRRLVGAASPFSASR